MNDFWLPGLTLEETERRIIEFAFRYFGNNKAATADSLGISIRTLDAKLASYQGVYLKNEPRKNRKLKEEAG